MRVLIINKFLYPNGGSETYIFKLGEALEQHGHEVQYFGMEHEGRCVGNRVNAYTSDIYSIVITTTIITTVTSMITNPPYMAYCLKLKWYTFYPMLLINIIGSVIMTVLFSFVAKAIAPSTWVGLIVTACILSIFGLGIYFIFVFSNKERKYIINMIKRKANIKQ